MFYVFSAYLTSQISTKEQYYVLILLHKWKLPQLLPATKDTALLNWHPFSGTYSRLHLSPIWQPFPKSVTSWPVFHCSPLGIYRRKIMVIARSKADILWEMMVEKLLKACNIQCGIFLRRNTPWNSKWRYWIRVSNVYLYTISVNMEKIWYRQNTV